jgi:hypothetical protein
MEAAGLGQALPEALQIGAAGGGVNCDADANGRDPPAGRSTR